MSRLNKEIHPLLTPELLSSLFNKSIYTSLSFVCTNPKLLAKTTGLQYNQVLQIKDSILTKFSSTLRRGDKFYQEIINHCAILPTGIDSLDKLLDSGLMTGNIYELCGFSGCGKTQICMTVAANICATSQQEVFYIDTKNDISSHRLFDIIEHHKVPDVGKVLQKIQICYVKSAYELLKELHQLQKKLINTKEKFLGYRLIIIDSLSALFQQFHNQNEGLSILNNVADLLKHICVEYHMVVLLTNFVSTWTADVSTEVEREEEDQLISFQVQQPALGKYWAHVPNYRIMVKKLDGSNECILVILKSSNQPVGKSVKVKVSDAGIT